MYYILERQEMLVELYKTVLQIFWKALIQAGFKQLYKKQQFYLL